MSHSSYVCLKNYIKRKGKSKILVGTSLDCNCTNIYIYISRSYLKPASRPDRIELPLIVRVPAGKHKLLRSLRDTISCQGKFLVPKICMLQRGKKCVASNFNGLKLVNGNKYFTEFV